MRTKSETLFEEFCLSSGIECSRIAESTTPRPDYLVRLQRVDLVCEIKQLEAGQRELEALRRAAAGEAAPYWDKNRLREKLKGVSRQLRQAAEDGVPTLLVVYDNSHFGMQLDDVDVKEALYGQIGLPVYTPTDGVPFAGGLFFGGNRALTPAHNTSVSAVGVLERVEGVPRLRIYHNLYAAVPLAPAEFGDAPVEHKVKPGDTSIEIQY